MSDPRYEVFLSYNSKDRSAVTRIAEKLRQHQLEPWLDSYYLPAGKRFQEGIVKALLASEACAVFLGPHGLGDWQVEEIGVAQDRAVKNPDYGLFLVLLPGLPDPYDPSTEYYFLNMRTWVDFRGGFEDPDDFQHLINAVAGLPMGPTNPIELASGEAPYRGLQVFDQEHAKFFFGREAEVQRLQEKLKASRFLAVVGPSGSGKSSVVRAGLLPALTNGVLSGSHEWPVRVFTPGSRPVDELSAQLVQIDPDRAMGKTLAELRQSPQTLDRAATLLLSGRPPLSRLVLVVDQFEEIFTLCTDEGERAHFLGNLLHAATVPNGRCLILLTLRADFYPRCAAYPGLATLLAAHQVLLGPLDEHGLRAAIEQPARRVGVRFEPGLVDTILGDVGTEPGSLPLLEHALYELWQRRQGTMLSLAAYRESGGVDRALATRADAVFEGLEEAEQVVARRVLLRLTQPGEETEDTRRRAELDELITRAGEREAVQHVVNRLVDARLLTTDQPVAGGAVQVDVAHEALIRAWPRLRAWLDEDREGFRIHRRLTEAAQEWERNQRDPDLLYRGARLAEAQALAARSPDLLNQQETAFLRDCIAKRERELALEAERLAAQERQRKRVITGLAVFSLVALILAGVAGLQWRNADAEATRAAIAQDRAENEATIALAGKLAAQSGTARQPDLGLLLSLESGRLQPGSVAAQSSLMSKLLAHPGLRKVFDGQGQYGPLASLAVSPDGTRLATGGADGAIRFWDVPSGAPIGESWWLTAGNVELLERLVFSPDGRWLAAEEWVNDAGIVSVVGLWDVEAGAPIGEPWRAESALVTALTFSPDGTRLAIADTDGAVVIWESATATPMTGPWTVADSGVDEVVFSQDGTQLIVLSGEGDISRWDIARAEPVGRPGHVTVGQLRAVAFNPDRTRLAVAANNDDNDEGTVTLWDLERFTPIGDPWRVPIERGWSVAFSPDGSQVASVDGSGVAVLWDIEQAAPVGDPWQIHASYVQDLAFSRDGALLAASGSNGAILLWDLARTSAIAVGQEIDAGLVRTAAFSADGTRLAVVTREDDDGVAWTAVALWDLEQQTRINGSWQRRVQWTSVSQVVFSPGRAQLAVVGGEAAGERAVVTLWDLERGVAIPGPWDELGDDVLTVAFSPDGARLITAELDGTVTSWDLASASPAASSWQVPDGLWSGGSLSPDARWLAASNEMLGPGREASVVLWDVASGTPLANAWRPTTGDVIDVIDVAFHPDGTQAAYAVSYGAGTDGTVVLWDIAEGRAIGEPLRGHIGYVIDVAFSPDGTRLASTGTDGTVILWDVASGEPIGNLLPAERASRGQVMFSPNREHLLFAGDGGISRWDVSLASWQEKACAIANRNLTEREWAMYLGEQQAYRQTCPTIAPTVTTPHPAAGGERAGQAIAVEAVHGVPSL